jgi:hypothetical protein
MSARPGWKKLYRDYELSREARDAARQRKVDEEKELERFDQWCAEAVDATMQRLADLARERAAEFEREFGEPVEVAYPSHAPLRFGDAGPWMTFLSLSLGKDEVHIYSTRADGGLPYVHFAFSPPEHSGRLMSVPGGFIAKAADDEPRLRSIPGSDSERSGELDPDDLVLRAFELLLMGVRALV